MQRLDVQPASAFGDVVLRTRPKWPIVIFFVLLGGLHLFIAIMTFLTGRWESFLSVIIGTVLLVVAFAISRFRFELAVLGSEKRIRLRTGIGRFDVERFISFDDVRGVRLTISGGGRHAESIIELLCPLEDILCPPTSIPRQEALFLAMALDVPLIKVSDEPADSGEPDRMNQIRS